MDFQYFLFQKNGFESLVIKTNDQPFASIYCFAIGVRDLKKYKNKIEKDLDFEMGEFEFLTQLKDIFKCGSIRHTAFLNKKIKKVAFCGGSGSFLLNQAKRLKADVYITGDFKYHEFFDAENQILIADIGHYESEQYTSDLIADILKKKFTTFAVHKTVINTNPINYF